MESAEVCRNCGNDHATGMCDYPNFMHRCPRCLVTSLNGTGHSTPCYPTHTVSSFRSDVYALSPTTLFAMRFPQGKIFSFDKASGQFIEVEDDFKLLSAATEGMFSASKTVDGLRCIFYDAISIKRFSIMFAVRNQSRWRFRFRAMLSATDGLLCFPMRKTFYNNGHLLQFPEEFSLNTVLIIGIDSPDEEINVNFKVLTNSDDRYVGKVIYSKKKDAVKISDNMNGAINYQRSFDQFSYDRNGPCLRNEPLEKNQRSGIDAFERLTQSSSLQQQSLPQSSTSSAGHPTAIDVDADSQKEDETKSLPQSSNSSANHPSKIAVDADSRKEDEAQSTLSSSKSQPAEISEVILDAIIEAAVMASQQQ